MKKVLALSIALTLISTTALADTVHLKIGENRALVNKEMGFIDRGNPSVAPLTVNNRTLIPVRFVSEAFGCDVTWEGESESIIITNPKSLIKMQVGVSKMSVESSGSVKEYELDVPPQLIGERTYLPLRSLAENALGKTVTWYEENQIICIADEGETYYEDVQAQFKQPAFSLDSYPKTDCSTATIPFVNALNEKMLGIGKKAAESITVSSKTHGAYVKLIEGKCDIIFVTEPSEDELALAKQAGVELEVTPFCNEGFVFLTHKDNPIQSLTLQQVQDIYQGKITNWKEVGGSDEAIVAYQRNANSGSQTIMENVVMKGLTLAKPPTEEVIFGMGELIDAVANYQNTSGAIGYSVYYYANEMKKNPDIKLIGINDVLPTPETIQSKQYPLTVGYYAVTLKGKSSENTQKLLKWILSGEGQQLVSDSGYVKVTN